MTDHVLKCETETIIKVTYYDLEEFIEKVVGHPYEVIASEEWSNDSQHHISVDGKLDSYDKEGWTNFKKNGGAECFSLHLILKGLCSEGHIAPGNYLVTVCW